jgi:hypothetical protein
VVGNQQFRERQEAVALHRCSMKFSEWIKLREVGTSTASVANVPMRLFGGAVQRMYPEPVIIGGREVKHNKKKKKNNS